MKAPQKSFRSDMIRGRVALAASLVTIAGTIPAVGISLWRAHPLLLATVLCLLAGGSAGYWLGLRRPGKDEVDPKDERIRELTVGGRVTAHELTSVSWYRFPEWQWTLKTSEAAFHVAVKRLEERIHDGMTQHEVDEVVEAAVSMYITEIMAGRKIPLRRAARSNSWVNSWRY